MGATVQMADGILSRGWERPRDMTEAAAPALGAAPSVGGLSKRQRQIVARVRDHGFVTIETLAEEFDTSAQTVRRDIIRLSEVGLLQRFHGGAGLADTTARPMRARASDDRSEEKRRVGLCVAGLITNGSTVFLDGGSTAQAVGEALREHQGLRIVTNNLLAALSAGRSGPGQVHLTGGELRGDDGTLVGSQTVSMLQDIRVDTAVIGCAGFDTDGSPMDFDGERIAVKRAAMRSARVVVLATDPSKFLRQALMRVAPASSLSVVASSAPPPPALADAFAAAQVRVVVG